MRIEKIVILGAGVSGCALAASLSHALLKTGIGISVIDFDQSRDDDEWQGSVTLAPNTQVFHERLGLDEAKILTATQGTFSLGAHFNGWINPTNEFWQTYSGSGVDFNGIDFQNFYVKFKEKDALPGYERFSLCAMAAMADRFSHPASDVKSVISSLNYGLNLDRSAYAEVLKKYSEGNGVRFISDQFVGVTFNEDETLKEIVLKEGIIDGELFIDCSGAAALLMQCVPDISSVDWSAYFSCDQRAIFVRDQAGKIPVVTDFVAHENYWRKSVPLQGCSVNSVVFNGKYVEQGGLVKLLKEPGIVIKPVKSGHKSRFWHKNLVAFGQAAITAEHFLFSDLDLLYQNIQTFLGIFPLDTDSAINASQYNRVTYEAYEQFRDYQLAHYSLAAMRLDSEFWRGCRPLNLTRALTHRINLFRTRAKIACQNSGLIPPFMWVSLFLGFDMLPEAYDPLVDAINDVEIQDKLQRMQKIIAQAADSMPFHKDYLERYLRKT